MTLDMEESATTLVEAIIVSEGPKAIEIVDHLGYGAWFAETGDFAFWLSEVLKAGLLEHGTAHTAREIAAAMLFFRGSASTRDLPRVETR